MLVEHKLSKDQPPLPGVWRYSNGYLFCGTIRVCALSLDTAPAAEFVDELGDWMQSQLNGPHNMNEQG